MIKIAIIGASEFQFPLVEYCNKIGVETHVFAWEKESMAKKIAKKFYPISITDFENISKKCEEINVDGICSIGSELAMLTVSKVASKLKLHSNSVNSAKLTQNKSLMKICFRKFGVDCADGMEFFELEKAEKYAINLLEIYNSIIVKPTDRSGSLSVSHVKSIDQLSKAFCDAQKSSFTKSVIIEEYINGNEYSIESISYKRTHRIIAITKKYTTESPFFVENGHFQPSDLSKSILNKINILIKKALSSLEISDGISHTELKILKDGKIKVIEVGGRMGGDFIGSHITKYCTGVDLIKAALEISIGKFRWSNFVIKKHIPSGVVFLTSNKNGRLISCEKKIIRNRKIYKEFINNKLNDKIEITTNSSDRFGYIIYSGDIISTYEALKHFGLKIITE